MALGVPIIPSAIRLDMHHETVRFLLARLGREGVPGRSLGAHTGQRRRERAARRRAVSRHRVHGGYERLLPDVASGSQAV